MKGAIDRRALSMTKRLLARDDYGGEPRGRSENHIFRLIEAIPKWWTITGAYNEHTKEPKSTKWTLILGTEEEMRPLPYPPASVVAAVHECTTHKDPSIEIKYWTKSYWEFMISPKSILGWFRNHILTRVMSDVEAVYHRPLFKC